MRLIFISLLVSLSTIVSSVTAHDQDPVLNLLSQQRTWIKLLHLKHYESEIENTEFFLTTINDDFAYNELVATVVAVSENKTDVNGFSYRCLYPARTEFLAQHGLTQAISASECPALFEWIGSENYDISIVYADGFLGNPASFYGHLIIKFDHADNKSQLLNNSLNFGATVPDNENNLVYIVKGLFGGYSAQYTSNYFYRYNLNYTEVELRDLWKYTLNLSEAKKRLVAFHAWELMNSQYTYYFTHRNCAYHVAKLIEVVTSEDLVDSSHPFVLPIAVFSAAMQTYVDGQKLISNIEYLPSRQTRMRQGSDRLSDNNKKRLALLVEGNIEQGLQGLTEQEKIAVLDVAYDYIEFVLTQLDKTTSEFAAFNAIKLKIQVSRIRLPKSTAQTEIIQPTLQPHEGHKPSLIRGSVGINESNSYQEILLRPAFYDMYSYGGGMLKNSSLSMFEVGLRFSDLQNEISKVHLLNIETYPTGGTGLSFDNNIAWKTKLGFEREYTDGLENTGEWFVEAGLGKPYQLTSDLLMYANLNGRLQTPDTIGNRLFVLPTAGLLWSTEHVRVGCHLSYYISARQNKNFNRRNISCEASLFQTHQFDIRVKYKNFHTREFQVGASWYW